MMTNACEPLMLVGMMPTNTATALAQSERGWRRLEQATNMIFWSAKTRGSRVNPLLRICGGVRSIPARSTESSAGRENDDDGPWEP